MHQNVCHFLVDLYKIWCFQAESWEILRFSKILESLNIILFAGRSVSIKDSGKYLGLVRHLFSSCYYHIIFVRIIQKVLRITKSRIYMTICNFDTGLAHTVTYL